MSSVRCQLVWAPDDAEVADRLATALTEAGATIIDAGASPDAAVVLLSDEALRDDAWREGLPFATLRLIPVRIGRFDDDAVPQYLRDLNWIEWRDAAPAVTAGLVAAALFTDPSLVRVSQQLNHEATAWERGGRHRELLIDDYQRAKQLDNVLDKLSADPMAVPSPMVVAFVRASVIAGRRARRRRRAWRLVGGVGAVIGISGIFSVIPQIARLGHNNKEAIVTAGNEAMIHDTPEWAAANAAALLVTGGGATRKLGRETLLQSLGHPWRVSTINLQWNLTASSVFGGGHLDAVVHRPKTISRLAIVDIRTTRTRWTMPLGPGKYQGIAVSTDGRRAVIVGPGVLLVDLITRDARRVVANGDYYTVQFADDDTAVLYGVHGISILNLRTGRVRPVPFHILDVLDVENVGHGRVEVLFERTAGHLMLADVLSAKILASAAIPPGETPAGAISPDGRRAIVAAHNGELWTFGVGRTAAPTGIPVPVGMNGMHWGTNNRIIVFSDADGANVIYLPRAESLGEICREVPQLLAINQDRTSDMVQCVGRSLDAVWKLPPAPRRASASKRRPQALVRGRTQLRVRRDQIRIFDADGSNATKWFAPVDDDVSAVALSPDGRRVLVGSKVGGVAIIERNGTGARIVATWHVPDAAAVVSARIDAAPQVITSSHQQWTVPDCPGCGTDEGLIQEFHRRFSGCLTARQTALMGDNSRGLLGIPACESVARD